jgi:hypothetical protein
MDEIDPILFPDNKSFNTEFNSISIDINNQSEQFNIPDSFPNREEMIKILKIHKELFTTPIKGHMMDAPPMPIELYDNAQLKMFTFRRTSPVIEKEIKNEVDRLLEEGIIEPSQSCCAWPLVVVPKPDGNIRMCVDYTYLNNLTIPMRFLIPIVEDAINMVGGHKYYAALDLRQGCC